jgi:hypothetical protein
LHVHPEVGLLAHMIAFVLISEEPPYYFPYILNHFTFPKEFTGIQISWHSHQNFFMVIVSSKMCGNTSFTFPFSSNICLPFSVFFGEISKQFFGHLKKLLKRCFPYIFWKLITYQICDL